MCTLISAAVGLLDLVISVPVCDFLICCENDHIAIISCKSRNSLRGYTALPA